MLRKRMIITPGNTTKVTHKTKNTYIGILTDFITCVQTLVNLISYFVTFWKVYALFYA